MSRTVSLCITYVYHDPNNGPRPSVYRIADYEDGEFYPLEPQSFTDDIFNFNPRYLRTRAGEEGRLYTPTIRSWKAIAKHDDPDRMTTESYQFTDYEFFEVVIIKDLMDPDAISLQSKLRSGFSLPIGICDTFLLALDQDDTTYTVAKCRRSMLKQVGDLFCFDDNISDMLHATHYLETYVIDKVDVFNTSRFSGFNYEDRSNAPTRSFYRFDCLPESDGLFYLHEISEYIPFFVTRFLKKEAKKYELSKAQIQKIATAIEEAVASKESIEAFFGVTGYSVEEIKQLLPEYKETISKALLSYDEIDRILASFLESDAEIRIRMIELAKHNWLLQADQDREDAEQELAFLKDQVASTEKTLDDLLEHGMKAEEKIAALNDEIRLLGIQKSDIERAASEAVQNLETTIGNYLSNHAFIRRIGSSGTYETKQDASGFVTSYPLELADSQCHQIDKHAQAVGVLQSNLKRGGMSAYYANIISAQVHSVKSRVRAFIVSAVYARSFANALSNSIDGHNSTVISVVNTQPDFLQLRAAIDQVPGRVVLVENMLDYCNTALYSFVCRDNMDRLLVFSVDDEAGLAVVPKSIWNYAWLINADVAYETWNDNVQYTKALVEEFKDKISIEPSLEGYSELDAMLLKLGLPLMARLNIVGMIRFIDDHCKPIDPVVYIDSIVAKLCSIYSAVVPEETLLPIVEELSENISNLYFKQ